MLNTRLCENVLRSEKFVNTLHLNRSVFSLGKKTFLKCHSTQVQSRIISFTLNFDRLENRNNCHNNTDLRLVVAGGSIVGDFSFQFLNFKPIDDCSHWCFEHKILRSIIKTFSRKKAFVVCFAGSVHSDVLKRSSDLISDSSCKCVPGFFRKT